MSAIASIETWQPLAYVSHRRRYQLNRTNGATEISTHDDLSEASDMLEAFGRAHADDAEAVAGIYDFHTLTFVDAFCGGVA
ncbi:hypothetical protein [Sphingomonas sp. NFR15]|uniref:hypothetical protein n=1 Tax=Sphingomonas sp. NFR15 TaxID=1566282 RepID=UPI000886F8A0|nr:hypothetical protein [Sphingomonas sp. NFR15]SDA15113.1 hypothetical protein SAMN03159340_00643 [Sphingomonas sp. NFR15]